jgi:hypothetical protein
LYLSTARRQGRFNSSGLRQAPNVIGNPYRFPMEELNFWQQEVINRILSSKVPLITSVNNVDFFAYLSFNRTKYDEIANQIKTQNWEQLISNDDKFETDFREDLTLVKFTNQNAQNCVATIYDSDELWQDPEVIDIFVF